VTDERQESWRDDGQVSTCCSPEFYITGNIMDSSLYDVWNGKRYKALRATLNGEHPPSACENCHLLRRQY